MATEDEKKKGAAVLSTDETYKNALNENTQAVKTAGDEAKKGIQSSFEKQESGLKSLKDVYDEAANWSNEGADDVKKSREEQTKAYDAILEENRPLTEEEKAKQRKRRRNAALWTAIGDGIASIAGLVSTANYGQPFKANKTMSERLRERWKELDDDRKDKQDLYLNALAKKGALTKEAYEQYRNEHKDKMEAKAGGANVNIELGKAGAQHAKDMYGVDKSVGDAALGNAKEAHGVDTKREQIEEEKRKNRASESLARQKFSYEKSKDKDKRAKQNSITISDEGKDVALGFDNELKGALISYAKDVVPGAPAWMNEQKSDDDYLTDLQTEARKNPEVSRAIKGIVEKGYYSSQEIMSEDEAAQYEIKE